MKDFDKVDDFDISFSTVHEMDNLSDREISAVSRLDQSLKSWLLRKKIERRRDRAVLRQMLEDYQHFTLDEKTPSDTRH